MKGVSVIICCYNSSSRLPKTLEYLAKQQLAPHINWEVIVVNNASKDNTKEVALKEWSKYKLATSFKVVDQSSPGLSYAREKGINESLYDLLIFCDDDNWLFPTYLQKAFELAQQYNDVAAIGGQGFAVSNVDLPDWFETYKEYYACYPQASSSGELSGVTSFLYGAGLVIRKEKLLELESKGFKSFLTDRIGTSLISGGDNELCYALRLAGNKLYYSNDLKFYHFVPEGRLTKEYLARLIKAISYSSMSLIIYHYAISEKKITRISWFKDFLYRFCILLIDIGKSLSAKDPFTRRMLRHSSYKAFLAIINLYGNYRKNYKTLLALKG